MTILRKGGAKGLGLSVYHKVFTRVVVVKACRTYLRTGFPAFWEYALLNVRQNPHVEGHIRVQVGVRLPGMLY